MSRREDADKNGFGRRQMLGGLAAAALGVGCATRLKTGKDTAADSTKGNTETANSESSKPRIRSHRQLGRTGFSVSDIALGCGSLADSNVVRFAYDSGVNLFDVAETYGNGDSERKIGQAMKHMDRSKIFVVTKLKIHDKEDEQSLLRRFTQCQERLNTPYVDALYMHSVTDVTQVNHEAFHKACARLKADGRLRFVGISSHGPRGAEGDSMEKVLSAAASDGRFDLMLMTINFMNEQAARRVLEVCKAKQVGTCAMKTTPGAITIEPFDPKNPTGEYAKAMERMLAGGRSREDAIKRIRRWIDKSKQAMKPTQAFMAKYGIEGEKQLEARSIQYVLNIPDMHTVLLSMRDFEKLEQLLPLSGSKLSANSSRWLRAYARAYAQAYCRHGCNDCAEACPADVPVATIMRYAQYFRLQGREKLAMSKYLHLAGRDAGHCLDCLAPCERACPHGLPVQASLLSAHGLLRLS